MYYQGDLVALKFPVPLPGKGEGRHPVLIVSSNESNQEDLYTAIMMTSSEFFEDKFSFACADQMFEKKLEKQGCQLRMFILVSFSTHEVYRKVNAMQPFHLKNVLRRLKSQIFSISNE